MSRGKKSNTSMAETDFSASGGGIDDFEEEGLGDMDLGDEGY